MNLRASSDEVTALAGKISAAVRDAGGGAAVCRASGTPPRTLSKYIAGDAVPSAFALARIAQATGKAMDWFFDLTPAQKGYSSNKIAASDKADIAFIPILDVLAGAGPGVDNGDVEVIAQLPFPVGFLRRLRIKPERCRAVRAIGDSMEPTIPDGMLVLLNTAITDLVDGRIYAITAPDGLRLKRIQRHIDGSVSLISDNRDKYLAETLTQDEASSLSVVGRVFWTERLV